MEPVISPEVRQTLLGQRIVDVSSQEGRPGGHNNDCVALTLESGARIEFDAYNPGYLRVTDAADG